MRFVHIADIHLGMGFEKASFGPRKGKERRREIKDTFYRVLEYCEAEQIDLLLVAGDLFEDELISLSDLKDINFKCSTLSKTKVLISAGNHDPLKGSASPYKMVEWCDQVYLYGNDMASIFLKEINTEVWSFSWDRRHIPPLDTDSLPPMDSSRHQILMLHGDVYQENDYHYIDPKKVTSLGYDYIALGHIHKWDFVRDNMVYPGSLEPLDFAETGSHGFVEGRLKDHCLEASFVPFSLREFHRVDVTVDGTMVFEEMWEAAKKAMQNMPEKDYYRITFVGDVAPGVALDLGIIQERLEESYHYVEVRDKTVLDLDIEQMARDYEGTLIGAYINALSHKGSEDIIAAEALKRGLRILLEEQKRS